MAKRESPQAGLTRTGKGKVAISADRGYLRLRWRWQGKRYSMALGLPDSAVNRASANKRAQQIELDIASGNFDATLLKYKPKAKPGAQSITSGSLFGQFTAERSKARGLTKRSLEKYQAIQAHLESFFGDKSVEQIDPNAAQSFGKWLGTRLSSLTVKQHLFLVKSCWDWAITSNQLEDPNPWVDVVKAVKVPPKQMPKPFTREEIGVILHAFRTDRYYASLYRFRRVPIWDRLQNWRSDWVAVESCERELLEVFGLESLSRVAFVKQPRQTGAGQSFSLQGSPKCCNPVRGLKRILMTWSSFPLVEIPLMTTTFGTELGRQSYLDWKLSIVNHTLLATL